MKRLIFPEHFTLSELVCLNGAQMAERKGAIKFSRKTKVECMELRIRLNKILLGNSDAEKELESRL